MKNAIFDYPLRPRELDHLLRPRGDFGGNRAFFTKYAELIGDVLKDFKLEPLRREHLSPTVKPEVFERLASVPELIAFIDPGVQGGKRFAHLHYRGEVYMLNSDQWRTLTGRVKDDMMRRIEIADSISLEQFEELSDVVDAIG